MARNGDWHQDVELQEIMEAFVNRFPNIFEGFDPSDLHVIFTEKKKTGPVIKLRPQRYPQDVFVGKPYIVEVIDELWKKLDAKRRNLAVFHIMCSIPQGGFDPESRFYAKKVRPDIQMFSLEFAACGGVPNWMENSEALDPLKESAVLNVMGEGDPIPPVREIGDDGVERRAVTEKDVAEVV